MLLSMPNFWTRSLPGILDNASDRTGSKARDGAISTLVLGGQNSGVPKNLPVAPHMYIAASSSAAPHTLSDPLAAAPCEYIKPEKMEANATTFISVRRWIGQSKTILFGLLSSGRTIFVFCGKLINILVSLRIVRDKVLMEVTDGSG